MNMTTPDFAIHGVTADLSRSGLPQSRYSRLRYFLHWNTRMLVDAMIIFTGVFVVYCWAAVQLDKPLQLSRSVLAGSVASLVGLSVFIVFGIYMPDLSPLKIIATTRYLRCMTFLWLFVGLSFFWIDGRGRYTILLTMLLLNILFGSERCIWAAALRKKGDTNQGWQVLFIDRNLSRTTGRPSWNVSNRPESVTTLVEEYPRKHQKFIEVDYAFALAPTSWSRAIPHAVAMVRRALDVTAAIILLGSLFPLICVVAVLIKLDSRGPVFFRQWRVGKNGCHFEMWKFRSMKAETDCYQRSPVSDSDPRLTGFGRILRRTSVDELPQLINVLLGEMSLVGPRPEMPFLADKHGALERLRLLVKPGITGLWQISPARAFPIHENIEYDLYYGLHQSLFLDFAILLRTLGAVARGIGAS